MNAFVRINRTRIYAYARACTLALAVLFAVAIADPAVAESNSCSSNSKSGGTVTFTLPTEIVAPQDGAMGSILWTSPPVAPVNPASFSSCGTNVPNGVANATWGGPGAADNTVYPTNLGWLSYRILQSSTGLRAFPSQAFPGSTAAANAEISSPFQLQLVITGPVPSGVETFPTGQLVTWDFALGGGRLFSVDTFSIGGAGAVRIVRPCVVTVDPTTVTLPSVTVPTFTGIGSTTGTTPFQIKLANCPTGNQLSITLNTADQQTGTTSVIHNTAVAPRSGGVGVQLLDASDNPITFGAAIPEGKISGAVVNLPFAARYYQTESTVTPGSVVVTATYTLSYP